MLSKNCSRFRTNLFVLGVLLFTLLACNFPTLVNQQSFEGQSPNVVYVTATPESTPLVYEEETPFDPNEMESLPEVSPVTWQVRTSAEWLLTTGDIGPSGGTITVSEPGSPLDGFTITVPQDSYENMVHFEVSTADITSINLPEGLELITPLISIDNGGVEASEFLELRLPRQIAEGKFAMLFTYDPESEAMDALPLLEIDAAHLTALTTHFSNILGVEVNTAELDALNIQTGFKQGRNNWQFANYGSFIAPGGHCAGQTLMAMDYFVRFKGAPLFGKYDNYGNPGFPVSPNQQDDDRLAYRMCSVAQQRMDFENLGNKYWFKVQGKGSGYITYYSFALALKASNEPQFISIFSAEGGHAMIVYGKYADRFYISDPNYPQADARRYISYNRGAGKFRPYFSGPNAADLGHPFPEIYYMNKYFRMNQAAGAALWAELEAGTVGDDWFPKYKILSLTFQPDGTALDFEITNPYFFVDGPEAEIAISSDTDYWTRIYDKDNNLIKEFVGYGSEFLPVITPLGTQYLFDIYGQVATEWQWIDGRWLTLYRGINGKWHGPACAEGETNPYRWEIKLSQTGDGSAVGDVYFHACPGGGAVFYSLTGMQNPGEDWVTLKGTKTGGRGNLGNNSSQVVTFTVKLNEAPAPNFAP